MRAEAAAERPRALPHRHRGATRGVRASTSATPVRTGRERRASRSYADEVAAEPDALDRTPRRRTTRPRLRGRPPDAAPRRVAGVVAVVGRRGRGPGGRGRLVGGWLGTERRRRRDRSPSDAGSPASPSGAVGRPRRGDGRLPAARAPGHPGRLRWCRPWRRPTRTSADRVVRYDPAQLLDGGGPPAWRMPGDGTGELITIRLAQPGVVTEVGLINGYAKTRATAAAAGLVPPQPPGARGRLVLRRRQRGHPAPRRCARTLQTVARGPTSAPGPIRLRLLDVTPPAPGPAAAATTPPSASVSRSFGRRLRAAPATAGGSSRRRPRETSRWVTRRTVVGPTVATRPPRRGSGDERRGVWPLDDHDVGVDRGGVDTARPRRAAGRGRGRRRAARRGGRGRSSPAAARMPTCRIPPPIRLRQTRASAIGVGRADQQRADRRAEALGQADRSTSATAPYSASGMPVATWAFQIRAPSRWTRTPTASAHAAERRAGRRCGCTAPPAKLWVFSTEIAGGAARRTGPCPGRTSARIAGRSTWPRGWVQVRIVRPVYAAWAPSSARAMCADDSQSTSCPAPASDRTASRLAIDPVGVNSAASCPNSAATRSSQRSDRRVLAVHVVADLGAAIAARIASVGRVTVSERRSIAISAACPRTSASRRRGRPARATACG